jgi:Rad3-related DNA helicase
MFFSATILDVKLWAENLGIDLNQVHHIQTECDFPVENRPVHLEFAGNCGKKHFDPRENPTDPTKPKFIAKVKQILKRHEGQRGIIHSHSFELAKVIREEIGDERFLFQDDFSGDKQLMLSAHASREDSVIVAPAVHEGYDFKDDLARWQIIAKIPWPSLGDRLIKERMARDDRYYGWLTALKITQSAGRSTRSKTDWSYVYIVDSGFTSFFNRHGNMLPPWLKEALKKYPPKLPIRRE